VIVPFLFSLPYAVSGRHPDNPFAGLSGLGGVFGGLLAPRFRTPDYWALDKDSRRRVREIQRCGEASGDLLLDGVAAQRLQLAAQGQSSSKKAMPFLFALIVVVPIIAAVRADHWWLLAAVLETAVFARAIAVRDRDPARTRLRRLQAGRAAADA
jgi:hypothetical protein